MAETKVNFKKIIFNIVHVRLRQFIMGLRIIYLNKVYGMHIAPSAKISLKANLDYTYPAGVIIGEGSYLAFGSTILAHDMSRDLQKPVKVGKNCFIGANAILLPGVELGDHVIVGAGAVVTKSFPSNVIITGNPAKIVKSGITTARLGILEAA